MQRLLPSFTHSTSTVREDTNIYRCDRILTMPSFEVTYYLLAGTCTANLCNKSEVPSFTHIKDIEGTPKTTCIIRANFEVLRPNRN